MKQSKIHIDKCPICGEGLFKDYLTCRDFCITKEKFVIQECSTCGFRFTQDVPNETDIVHYYEFPEYISHSDTKKGIMNKIYHRVRNYMLKKKVVLVEKLNQGENGCLLDIGTGTGYFPALMKKHGWNVEAVERDLQVCKFASKKWGLQVLNSTYLNSFPDECFDIITMWHVMEHIGNLNELWIALKRQLKRSGFLIIALPNCSAIDANMYESFWAAYDVPRHLWHFTPTTIERMAHKFGFCLYKTVSMPFDVFYISMLSEKYKGSSMYFLKGIYKGCLAYFRSCGNTKKSSSIIYIFQRE